MNVNSSSPSASPSRRPWLAGLIKRIIRVVVLGLLLTGFYAWAVPHFYPREGVPGFAHGLLHGAIMPMALPALALGRDVVIYADKSTGRTYKLGYTIGINLCGLIVFGTAFWTPKRHTAAPQKLSSG